MKDFKYVQRLYWQAYNTIEKVNHVIDTFKKYKKACDEIALFEVGYCMEDRFIPLIELEKRTAHITYAIERFKTAGYGKVHINIMNIYGHGDSVSVMKYEPDFSTMVGHDGIKSSFVPCPNSESFRKYLINKCILLAKCGPDAIWIDDDVRMQYHGKVRFGCFCDTCLSGFNEMSEKTFTRQGLVNELCKDHFPHENTLRKQWLLFNRKTIENTIRIVKDTVHSIDPDILLGLMTPNFSFNMYSAPDLKEYGEILKNAKGDLMIRPGSGFWTDDHPVGLIYKGLEIRKLVCLANNEAEFLSEIEGWPYQTLKKTPDLTALEITSHIGIGSVSGLTVNLYECMGNKGTEQHSYFKMLAEKREYFTNLSDAIKGHKQIGFYPFSDDLIWAYNDSKSDLSEFTAVSALRSHTLIELGIPLCFDKDDNLGVLISGNAAKGLSHDALVSFSKKGIYVDGEAASHISRAFPDKNFLGITPVEFPSSGVYEKYTESPLNGVYNGYNRTSDNFTNISNGKDFALELNGAASLTELYDYDDKPLGISGMTIYESNNETRAVVSGYLPWEHIHFLHKRHQIAEALFWLSRNRMPVKIMSPYKIAQSVWESGDDSVIILYNISFQRADEVLLYLRYEGDVFELDTNGIWEKRGEIINNSYNITDFAPFSSRALRINKNLEDRI